MNCAASLSPPHHPRRLLFHDHLAQEDHDPQVLAERLAQHYAMLDFAPRRGHERSFLHRTSSCRSGELLLTGGYTTPIQGEIGEQPGMGAVNFIVSGAARYRTGRGQEIRLSPERPLFFSPGAGYEYAVEEHFNGAAFQVELARLQRTAAAIAGLGVSARRFGLDLDQVRGVQPHDQASRELLQVLVTAFRLVDHPELEFTGMLPHLQLDDLIYRTLALLLCPKLAQLGSAETDPGCGSRQVFSELLEWVHANLHQPLSLSQLEARSGYSRRHLQKAFQQRFGCGPIQWVRQQRLEQARQALLQAEPGTTVAAVAARFRFSSLSVFSREFRLHFGLCARDVLREGQRHSR